MCRRMFEAFARKGDTIAVPKVTTPPFTLIHPDVLKLTMAR